MFAQNRLMPAVSPIFERSSFIRALHKVGYSNWFCFFTIAARQEQGSAHFDRLKHNTMSPQQPSKYARGRKWEYATFFCLFLKKFALTILMGGKKLRYFFFQSLPATPPPKINCWQGRAVRGGIAQSSQTGLIHATGLCCLPYICMPQI